MRQFFGRKSRNTLASVIMVSLLLHIVAILIFGTVKFVTAMREKEKVFEAPPLAPPPQKEPEYTVNLQQRNQSTPHPVLRQSSSTIPLSWISRLWISM